MSSKILVCDKDRSYTEALGAYFISLNFDLEITLYSSLKAFESDEKEYDLGLLSKDFIGCLDTFCRDRIKKCVLLADKMDEQPEDMEMLYKFQQMSAFKSIILSLSGNVNKTYSNSGSKWVGITSPSRHELAGLFSMAYAKGESKGGDVLFLDLESNSILPELLEDESAKTITDYLYLLEGNGANEDELMGCFSYYDIVTYLAPAKYYGEIVSVKPEVWEDFFDSISECSFREVVVLFDDAIRGTEALMKRLSKLIVLSREGDYYYKFDTQFRGYLEERGAMDIVKNVMLPLSAKNLDDGTYVIDQLMTGNLGKYALKAGAG